MFYIDSTEVEVDREYLYQRQQELCDDGIAVGDLTKQKDLLYAKLNKIIRKIHEETKIENLNSGKQIVDYFKKMLISSVIHKVDNEYVVFVRDFVTIACTFKENRLTLEDITQDEVRKALVYHELDIDIPKALEQVTEVIHAIYKSPYFVAYKTYGNGKGKWGSDKTILNEMKERGVVFGELMAQYRSYKKRLETIVSFMKYTDDKNMVHPKISIGKTGRVEYNSPAIMNIPKEMIWEVIAPRVKGNRLFSVDIKNQEPWIMMNMLGITELIDIVENGEDIYEGVFRRVFGYSPNKTERKQLKTAWNALTYGATKAGIKGICTSIDADSVCQYFNSLKQFKKYKASKRKDAKENRQLAETYFGLLMYANEPDREKLHRVLMDMPIQGTGTDILALLVKNFDIVNDTNEKVSLYFTRKDELIIEVDKDYIAEVGKENIIKFLTETFEHQIDDWVAFQVDIKDIQSEQEQKEKELFIS